MRMDYWDSLTNRIHGSFSSPSTMRVCEILSYLKKNLIKSPHRPVRYFGLKVFSILTVVPRRGLQQCYNNISVFILV